jgi:hypothetical protein
MCCGEEKNMDNPNDLTVHDLVVADTTTFGAGGRVSQGKRVTFWIGSHGPFVRNYDAASATTDRIKSDIDAQVSQLRELATYGQ